MKNLFLGLILGWLPLCGSGANAGPLDKKISIEAAPGYEFFELCRSLDVPCGIDSLLGTANDPAVFEAQNVSGRIALSRIMAQNPGYKWKFRAGILSVFPKGLTRGSPIDQQISVTFNNRTLAEIEAILTKEMGIGFGSRSVGGSETLDSTKVSLSSKNISVREVLDRVIRTHGHSMWILRRQDLSGSTPMYNLELYSYSISSTARRTENRKAK